MHCVIVLVTFCLISCGESLGIVINTLILDSTGFALNVTSSLISISMMINGECFPCLLSGFALRRTPLGIMSIDMPVFLKGINYLSPTGYATTALSIEAFKGFEFTCTDTQKNPDGSCLVQTGEQVLDLLNYHTSLASNIGALVAVTVGYRLIAYTVSRLSKADFGVTKKDVGSRLERVEVGN